jgi:hypothetical protein
MTEYNLQSSYVTVKSSTVVELRENFTLMTLEGPISFDAKITADFDGIDEKYHEVLLNMLTSKYANQVSFGHNPFSQCNPPKKRKWWEFWKAKYSI